MQLRTYDDDHPLQMVVSLKIPEWARPFVYQKLGLRPYQIGIRSDPDNLSHV